MIPIYICDDELSTAGQIEKLVKEQVSIFAFDMGPVYVSANPEVFFKQNSKEEVRGIYFLDIDFPGYENGFKLASKIRERDPRGFIIFITGHDDLAIQTFRYRLEVMDYIVKGNEQEMRKRIQVCLRSIEQRINDEAKIGGRYYSLKIFDVVHHIPIDNILYFEAQGRTHQILLYMEDEVIEFNGSLSQIAVELGEEFWRCHRGYLVNTKQIRYIHLKANEVELVNKAKCLLSRRAKASIPEALR